MSATSGIPLPPDLSAIVEGYATMTPCVLNFNTNTRNNGIHVRSCTSISHGHRSPDGVEMLKLTSQIRKTVGGDLLGENVLVAEDEWYIARHTLLECLTFDVSSYIYYQQKGGYVFNTAWITIGRFPPWEENPALKQIVQAEDHLVLVEDSGPVVNVPVLQHCVSMFDTTYY
jgi:hypothetical protein